MELQNIQGKVKALMLDLSVTLTTHFWDMPWAYVRTMENGAEENQFVLVCFIFKDF